MDVRRNNLSIVLPGEVEGKKIRFEQGRESLNSRGKVVLSPVRVFGAKNAEIFSGFFPCGIFIYRDQLLEETGEKKYFIAANYEIKYKC